MADRFLDLSSADRRDALEVAGAASGRPLHLLEKDVWVVWALETLFAAPYAPHLVFKGGTSLSKAYGVIRRFSEDVDLTYDIRTIAPDLVADSADALPSTRSQERRWTKEIRTRLADWVELGGSAIYRIRTGRGQIAGTRTCQGRQSFHRVRPLGLRHGLCSTRCHARIRGPCDGRAMALSPCRLRCSRAPSHTRFPTSANSGHEG